MIIAMIQALVVSFFLAGAATNNGLVVVGIGLICLVFMAILLWSGIKAIWRSFNGLFDAMGKATGGVFVSPGAAAQTVVAGTGAAAGAALTAGSSLTASGMSLAGNTLGGASALMNGASWAQAAGIAFGGSQTLTQGARMLTRLPGLHDSELEEVADQFVEGAATRQIARNVLLMGRVTGPVVGAVLLSDRNPENAYEDEEGRIRQPMLVPAVGKALAGITRGPNWKRRPAIDDDNEDGLSEGVFTPVAQVRMGIFTPIAPVPDSSSLDKDITELDADETANRQRSDYVAQEGGEEMEQHISEVVGSQPGGSRSNDVTRLDSASNHLERAADQIGDRLGRPAESPERAARQQQMQQFEGRLSVSGTANIAGVMGEVIAALQSHKGAESLKGVDNFTLAGTMAQALGVTPVENGKPPIESDLARFGVFPNQALTMGLSGEQADRVVREVKESPESALHQDTRAELVGQLHTERSLSYDEANQEVDRLEHTARLLPSDISAYGIMSVPSAPTTPTIHIEPQVDVRPDVQVTVQTAQDTTYAEGLKQQALLTGSAEMLDTAATPNEKGKE